MPGNDGVGATTSCGGMAVGRGACEGNMPMAGKIAPGPTTTLLGTTVSAPTGGSAGKATAASTCGEDFALNMIRDPASKQALQERRYISTTKDLTLLGRWLV